MANLERLLGADVSLMHKGFKRLITFQSRDIVDTLLNRGVVGSIPTYSIR